MNACDFGYSGKLGLETSKADVYMFELLVALYLDIVNTNFRNNKYNKHNKY